MSDSAVCDTAKVRVARGAKWLEEHVPGWYRHIHLPKFDISNGHQCVWGQLAQRNLEDWFGPVEGRRDHLADGYNQVVVYVDTHPAVMLPHTNAYDFMVAHGFTAGVLGYEAHPATFGELQAQWERVIGAKQLAEAKGQQTQ